MAIEIKQENTYLGIWNAAFTGGDFMAIGWKTPTGPWKVEYRFRYYVDRKVFDSNDTRNWYGFSARDGSEASRISVKIAMDTIMKLGVETHGWANGTYEECMGDGDKMGVLLKSLAHNGQPYIHVKELSEDGAKKYMGRNN